MNRVLIFIVLAALSGPVIAAPKNIEVELEELTTLTLKFYPGMGTRFLFPFILDEDDDYVPYTNNNTNDQVFVPIIREKGRNFFVISVPPSHIASNKDIGNMFMTIAGYQISVEMHSTSKQSEHVTDVKFIMTQRAREDLIQSAIAQRSKALEQSFEEKFKELDNMIEKRALAHVGMLALTEPTEIRIKEEGTMELKNGDEIAIYIDTALVYPEYRIVAFTVENDSSSHHINVVDAKLFNVDTSTGQRTPLDVAREIPKRVEPRGTATGVVVVHNDQMNSDNRMLLEVLTDVGTVEATW